MVLVITNERDLHADIICDGLKHWKADYLRLNTETFPGAVKATVRHVGTNVDVFWRAQNSRHDLLSASTVVFRRPLSPSLDHLEEHARRCVSADTEAFLWGLWRLLQHKRWVNPLAACKDAGYKPHNLWQAARHGFSVPKTLFSNDPARISAFAHECKDRLIYKPFDFHSVPGPDDSSKTVYTNIISLEQIDADAEAVAAAPGIYQEYIEKEIELRLTVIGDQVFACSIDSQNSRRGVVDWRRYDFDRTQYASYNLPKRISDLARIYVKSLGLLFGCIDMILTPQGEYVFLEINPNGQWLWVDIFTTMPLLEAYLDLLTARE